MNHTPKQQLVACESSKMFIYMCEYRNAGNKYIYIYNNNYYIGWWCLGWVWKNSAIACTRSIKIRNKTDLLSGWVVRHLTSREAGRR